MIDTAKRGRGSERERAIEREQERQELGRSRRRR